MTPPETAKWCWNSCALKAKVVTGNTKHLGRIPGIQCEDWIRG
jgi:hypothetical protein